MRFYTIFLLAIFAQLIAAPLRAQGSGSDLSPTGKLEWQALAEIAKGNLKNGADLYGQAAELAKKENNPMQFYYRYCQATNLLNLKDKLGAKSCYEKNDAELIATMGQQSEWQCFSLMAKYNQHNDFMRTDSLAYYVEKMVELETRWALSPENSFAKALLCQSIFHHYGKQQQAETAYKYILKAYNLINSPALKNTYRGAEICQVYIMSAMYADKISADIKVLNSDLINFCQQNSPQMDILLSRLAKTNYILAYIKKDTSEIRRQEKFYTQTVQKGVKPLSLEMANYYNDLGMVANTVFKDPIKSLELVSKGTAILEQLNTPLARTNLGISCRMLGDAFNNPKSPAYNIQQAQFYYTKAANALLRPEYQLKGDGVFPDFSKPEVYCHNDIIMLYAMQGFFNANFPAYEQSPTLSAKNKLLDLCLKALALAERHKQKAHSEADLNHWEELYFKMNKNLGEIHYIWYQKEKSVEDLNKLLHYSEQYKGVKIRSHLNEEKALVLANINPQEIAEYKLRKAQQEEALLEYHQQTEDKNREKASYFLEVYYEKTKRLNDIKTSFKQKYPLYKKLTSQSENKTIAELQQLLKPDMLMLTYFHYKRGDGILTISKDSTWIQLRNTVGDSQLITWSALAKILKNPSTEPSAQQTEKAILARNLRGMGLNLLPNETNWEKKGIKTLLIVPHSYLSILPFELLLTAEVEKPSAYRDFPFLLKKYAIQYAPSATLWAENKQTSAQNINNGKLLAFAPSYQKDTGGKERAVVSNSPREHLSELKGTVKELQSLESNYYGDYLYGTAANEAAFKSKLNQRYAIYHLAMHGLLNEAKPALSALAFSEQKGSAEDDFLNAFEIAQLSVRSQLVVLSACETAAAQMQINEGAMSIARYFMYGGAPSVVATRWQVNDATTAFIMQNFYKGLYEGKAISQAMREAQLSYLSQAQGEAAHPFYWAAFMSVGDVDKSVYLADKNWAMRYLIIFGSVSLFIIGLGWWKYRQKGKKAA